MEWNLKKKKKKLQTFSSFLWSSPLSVESVLKFDNDEKLPYFSWSINQFLNKSYFASDALTL